MDRRIIGMAVVLVAVVATVVTPGLTGRRTAGVAVRSADPVPGDCVRITTDDPLGPAAAALGPGLPTAELVSCSTSAAASVIARVPDAAAPSATSPEAGAGLTSICTGSAAALVRGWQGGVFRWSGDGITVELQAVLPVTGRPAGPDPEAVARGSTWGICYAVVGQSAIGDPSLTVLPAAGPPPASGLCYRNGADETARDGLPLSDLSSCDEPHRAQVLGTVTTVTSDAYSVDAPSMDEYGDPEAFRGICREYLRQATGLTDISAGGALTVVATSSRGFGGWCGLRTTDPTRTLSGSLLGLGSGPVPWS